MTAAASRLDSELVRRGLARSRARAAELVAAGRVTVGGAVARKASQPVRAEDGVDVSTDPGPDYVSRAAHKLAGALDAAEALDPGALVLTGARCLDVGASTGGFTQVLLERGAAQVLAVDVGRGQIAADVAADPRVVVREGTDVRSLTQPDVAPGVGVVTADVSFISLTHVLPGLLELVGPGTHLLVMVKPQFEVGRERLGSGGVVSSPELRTEAVTGVADLAVRHGAEVRAVLPSVLPGPSGNREVFLWLVAGGAGVGDAPETDGRHGLAVRVAVRSAVTEDRPVLVRAERRTPPRRPS